MARLLAPACTTSAAATTSTAPDGAIRTTLPFRSGRFHRERFSCARLNRTLLSSPCRTTGPVPAGTHPRHPIRGDRHDRQHRPRPVLEPAAQAFVEATANPPYLFDLAPAEGRKAVDEVQSGEIAKPAVDKEWITVPGGPTGQVRTRIVRPAGVTGTLPVIIYIHGAGWVFGNAHTHDRLVRELAVGANAAVVFPEYDLSPRPATRSPSSRTTPSPAGSWSRARPRTWTRRA